MKRPSVFFAAAITHVIALLAVNSSAQSTGSLLITNANRTPTAMTLHWTSAGTNVGYTIQSRAGLTDSLWLLPPATNPWPIETTSWTETLQPTNASRFYRVIAVPLAQRGKVITIQPGVLLTTNFIALLLNGAGVPLAPQYPVQLYKVIYETIDPLGARTAGSAAIAIPQGVGKTLPIFSYQHGTLTLTNDAPSALNIFGEAGIGAVIATFGYAAVLPDFLGLGSSPGLHPYHHARSEATACADALRAARALCASNNIVLNSQLFIAGYSQGGHATMALHRELEWFHTNEFTITASAPAAGAYDLSGVTTDDILAGRPQPNPYYFAYLLAAYQSVYQLAPTFGDLLKPPYNTTLPPLLAGNSTSAQINAAMPANPIDILKPELLAEFQTNSNHILRQALRDNDLYAWTPQSPMRMYHCAADADVIIANSQVAYTSFQARGATQVQFIDPQQTADHGDCAIPSLLAAKAWFDSLKQ
jgi:pimeloyl-ACP methyl ester carboxylesterase